MRGYVFAAATTFVTLAGCGLATSGLLFSPTPDPGTTLDGSPGPTPTLDGSGALDATAPPAGDAAGDDAGVGSGDDAGADAASDAYTGPDACAQTTDAGAIDTIVGWPGPPAPKIDGDLSDWPCGGRIDLTAANAAYVKTGPVAIAAQIEARWDKQNVYVAIHVTDPSVGGNDAINPYDNDSVEVYVSGDGALNGDYTATTHQYITDWKGLTVDYGPSHSGALPDGTHAHFTAATKTVGDGWSFEASIGWQALYAPGGNNSFGAATSLALDFEINDGDGSSQVAALILTMGPAQASCTCTQACCCGQSPDVPYCDSARIGRVTLE